MQARLLKFPFSFFGLVNARRTTHDAREARDAEAQTRNRLLIFR